MSDTEERPILFSAPMVRAYLAGLKTQTRRIVKDTDVRDVGAFGVAAYVTSRAVKERGRVLGRRDITKTCSYGGPGDKLWVKETSIIAPANFGPDDRRHQHVIDRDGNPRLIQYLATEPDREAAGWYGLKARPSIFMPRWASRITLEITSVRLERLQNISEEDAIAEGVELAYRDVPAAMGDCQAWRDYSGREEWYSSAWASYQELWESINGPGSWAANPWVWAISFPRRAP